MILTNHFFLIFYFFFLEFKIVMDDVSITHLGFGQEFVNAIEAKQVAQQDAERAKYTVMKKERNFYIEKNKKLLLKFNFFKTFFFCRGTHCNGYSIRRRSWGGSTY